MRRLLRGEAPAPPPKTYSEKQKVALTVNTTIRPDAAVHLDDAAFSHEFIYSNGVRAPLIAAAGISPTQLHANGTDTPAKLRSLGFDALSLTRSEFADELTRLYGATDVLETFLETPEDAATLAGERCLGDLGATTSLLLMMCAARPEEALVVIRNCQSLMGVPPETLILTGVSGKQLKSAGYSKETVRAQTGANGLELLQLGF